MYCHKCGKALPNEGFVCKFCGAMMNENQIKEQKRHLREHQNDFKLKTEMYGIEKINYREEKKEESLKIYLIIGGIIIILIILAIILNVL